jgi:ADP-ribosylglycohydrolase
MRKENLSGTEYIEKKLRGYLFGTACGDALGRSVEHLTLEQIKEKYGDKGISDVPPDSPWTDDTQLMLVIARSLLRGAELEIPKLMDIISEELVLWLDEPDLGAGFTSKGAALKLKEGTHWSESSIRSKTCGSLMRVGILGFIYWNNPEKLIQAALLSGRITHSHPVSDAASIAGAYAVKLALDGVEPQEMYEPLLDLTNGISPEFTAALAKAYEKANSGMKDENALKEIGEGWYADETFALAYFCTLRYPNDYRKAVQIAVNITGDSDSVGSVAGGILGAKLGIGAIPISWIQALKEQEKLEEMVWLLINKYFQVSGINEIFKDKVRSSGDK